MLSNFVGFLKRNSSFMALLLFFGVTSVAMATAPTSFDFSTAKSLPADVTSIVSNAVTSIFLITGGAVTLTALKSAVGLVAGLVRSMFSG